MTSDSPPSNCSLASCQVREEWTLYPFHLRFVDAPGMSLQVKTSHSTVWPTAFSVIISPMLKSSAKRVAPWKARQISEIMVPLRSAELAGVLPLVLCENIKPAVKTIWDLAYIGNYKLFVHICPTYLSGCFSSISTGLTNMQKDQLVTRLASE